MDLNKLFVTQHSLRNLEQLPDMIKFVRDNGMFTEESLGAYAIIKGLRPAPRIEVAQFEDGAYYLHNGHHRGVACYIGREARRIFAGEFFIRQWKYSDYTDIVLPHWITPFDPRVESRTAELAEWKKAVKQILETAGEAAAIDYINQNRSLYIQRRQIETVGDLAYDIKKKYSSLW